MTRERRRGRRPGNPEDTKRAILVAARGLFARHGFDRTTIRAIAAEADVDPALVIHHFGSKRACFAAAHELPVDPEVVLAEVRTVPPQERGRSIARAYLGRIVAPGSPALSLLRSAATDDHAARMLREYLGHVLLEHAPELVRGPNAEARMALVGSHLFGLAFGREILRVPALRALDVDDLVELVGPVVQRYLDGA